MALAVMAGLPIALLAIIEGGLRLAGVGHETDFWIKETRDGEASWVVNHAFTFQFFPKPLARGMIPHRVPVEKPDNTLRIVLFGESAANGDPDPAYGMGRHLELLLEGRFPDMDVEVICTAITAINSHVILPIARDSTRLDADLWILYMGNNEIIGPFGAGSVFGSRQLPLPLIRAHLAVKRTRIGQLMTSLMGRVGSDNLPATWGGIQMFAEYELHPGTPARKEVYRNFGKNLEAILKTARDAGVPVLLSTVASNLKDCAPFAALNDPGLSDRKLAEWNTLFAAGRAAQAEGRFTDALMAFREAAAIDNTHAGLAYQTGRSLLASGQPEAALDAFKRARDADALCVRAVTEINDRIRDAASRNPGTGIRLVDTARRLNGLSPDGIAGADTFYEHVHFTLQGNYRVARLLAGEVLDLFSDRMASVDTGDWPTIRYCQPRLAVSLWDKHRLWSDMHTQLTQPPFTQRSGNADTLALYAAKANFFKERIRPEFDRRIYEAALEADPQSYHLRYRYGHYLLVNGFTEEAIGMYRWITETFPGFEGGHQQLGLALLLDERPVQAEAAFRKVLEINPAHLRARKALKLIRND